MAAGHTSAKFAGFCKAGCGYYIVVGIEIFKPSDDDPWMCVACYEAWRKKHTRSRKGETAGLASRHWAIALFADITDIEDAKRVYRALAMAFHPDRGGDTVIAQTINAAYEARFGR